MSLRSRSRVRSSRLNSSSCVARSFGIGEIRRFVFHVRDGAIDFFHEIALPAVQDVPEVLELLLVHVRLATLGDVRLNIARAGEQAAGVVVAVVVGGGGARAGGKAGLRGRHAGRGHDDAFGWRCFANRLCNRRGAGAGAGFAAGAGAALGTGFAAAGALAGAGFAGALAATGLAAGFFAVNFGFSTFLGLAGFAAARLVGIVCRSRPGSRRGAGLQDAGLYRPTFLCTAA